MQRNMREYNDSELNHIYLHSRRGYWPGGHTCYSPAWDIFPVYWKLDSTTMEVTGLLDSICHISLLSPSELLLCKSQLGQSTVFVEPKFTIKSTLQRLILEYILQFKCYKYILIRTTVVVTVCPLCSLQPFSTHLKPYKINSVHSSFHVQFASCTSQ